MSGQRTYVGRFAPSPTGPLHFGSAVAALASYLDARAASGRWLLRIEDLDPPREIAAAPHWIMDQLESLGLAWDSEAVFQSSRLDAYQAALDQLEAADLVYPCLCSRKTTPPVYQGTCRERRFATTAKPYATRLRTDQRVISLTDRIAGTLQWQLEKEVGDFIVRRRDGLFAYQLAVVVDDQYQGVTDIVRGHDLLDSTPRQWYLAEQLGMSPARYAHIPVLLGEDGSKLSKQSHATPIATEDPLRVIRAALAALNQPVPEASSLSRLLQLAVEGWDIARVPTSQALHTSAYNLPDA